MVLPAVARGPEPDVLPLRVRQQEQLQPADQSSVLCQSRPLGEKDERCLTSMSTISIIVFPSALLQIHRPVHSDGSVPREVHLLGLHHALLQADAAQAAGHEGHRVHRPRVLQFTGKCSMYFIQYMNSPF